MSAVKEVPIFGDPDWIRRAIPAVPPLDSRIVVSYRDAVNAGCCPEGLDRFVKRELRGCRTATVEQLTIIMRDEPEYRWAIEQVLDYVATLDRVPRCVICNRIDEHAKWCWEAA